MTSNAEIHMMITKTAKEMADSMDEHILAFFGSEELAREYAQYFVIEQLPVDIYTEGQTDLAVHYTIETEIRIRHKTREELEADGLV